MTVLVLGAAAIRRYVVPSGVMSYLVLRGWFTGDQLTLILEH